MKVSVAATLLILLSSFAAGQDLDNVTISGKVADQNGAIIPGATVKVTLANTKVARWRHTLAS